MSDPMGGKNPPSRWVIGLVLLAHVLAGMAIGVALERFVFHHRHPPPFEFGMGGPGEPGGPDRHGPPDAREMDRHMADHLARDLKLSDDQRQQLEGMLPRHRAAFDSLRLEMEPKLKTLLDSSAAEISSILTPDQRQRWDEIRRRGPGEHGPPPR